MESGELSKTPKSLVKRSSLGTGGGFGSAVVTCGTDSLDGDMMTLDNFTYQPANSYTLASATNMR